MVNDKRDKVHRPRYTHAVNTTAYTRYASTVESMLVYEILSNCCCPPCEVPYTDINTAHVNGHPMRQMRTKVRKKRR